MNSGENALKDLHKKVVTYIITLIISTAALQLFIAFGQGHQVNWFSSVLLGIIAVYYYWFRKVNKKQINKTAYLDYFLHAITYIVVNGSFWLHASYLEYVDMGFIFNNTWTGVLIGMRVSWGIGLILHTVGTLFSKGYENVDF